jgi:hypothetical protein
MTSRLGEAVIALIMVATVPIAALTGLFLGLRVALAVLLVGWFFFLPAAGLVYGMTGGLRISTEADNRVEAEMKQAIQERHARSGPTVDPIQELRQRYARGEIDDLELEQKLDAILEMESLDPDDRTGIERTLETLETDGDGTQHGDTETPGAAPASTEQRQGDRTENTASTDTSAETSDSE